HPRLLRGIRAFCLANTLTCAWRRPCCLQAGPCESVPHAASTCRRCGTGLGASATNRVGRAPAPRPDLPVRPRRANRACGGIDDCTWSPATDRPRARLGGGSRRLRDAATAEDSGI